MRKKKQPPAQLNFSRFAILSKFGSCVENAPDSVQELEREQKKESDELEASKSSSRLAEAVQRGSAASQ